MRSSKEFLRRISSRLLLSPERLKAIGEIDPSHFYVENVRSIFGISTGLARRLCDLAVRQGLLTKRVQVLCPDSTVAAEAASVDLLPQEVYCTEEIDGNYEENSYATVSLQKLEYYIFNEGDYA